MNVIYTKIVRCGFNMSSTFMQFIFSNISYYAFILFQERGELPSFVTLSKYYKNVGNNIVKK